MIGIVLAAVLGASVLTLVWLRIAARHGERRSVRAYEKALGALGEVAERSEHRANVPRPGPREQARPHVHAPARADLPPPRRPPSTLAPRSPGAGNAAVDDTTRVMRPVRRSPETERSAASSASYGPPAPPAAAGATGATAGAADAAAVNDADIDTRSIGASWAGDAARTGAAADAGAVAAAGEPGEPGDAEAAGAAAAAASSGGEDPATELLGTVPRLPEVAALDQLVARSRLARSRSGAGGPATTSRNGRRNGAGSPGGTRPTPAAGNGFGDGEGARREAALQNGRRERLTLPRSETDAAAGSENGGASTGAGAALAGETVGGDLEEAGDERFAARTEGLSGEGAGGGAAAAEGATEATEGEAAEGEAAGEAGASLPSDTATELSPAVPIVFDFDELAEPPIPPSSLRPIKGLRPPAAPGGLGAAGGEGGALGERRALRVATGAAAVVTVAALGVGAWYLADQPGSKAPATASNTHPTTPTVPSRHHVTGTTKPASKTTAPPSQNSATVQPISQTGTLVVYAAPPGPYTVRFSVSSGDCWVGAHLPSGSWTWQATIYPGTPANYTTSGTAEIRLGAPSVLQVFLNGKPVTLLHGHVQPYDVEFKAS